MLRSSLIKQGMPRSGRALPRTRAIAAHLRAKSTMSVWEALDPVVKEESHGGVRIYKLNRPDKLNSLNEDMVDSLRAKIQGWHDSFTADIIVATGEGRAFCAGGDVASVISKVSDEKTRPQASSFFTKEFELDYILATLPKPYIAIMNGITMGGGVGLSSPAHFRIATENTLWAMPETAIGYSPDVGASYYLSRLEGEIGTYLGLTGARVSGRHAVELGLATHYIPSRQIPMLLESLSNLDSANMLQDKEDEEEKQDNEFERSERENKDEEDLTEEDIKAQQQEEIDQEREYQAEVLERKLKERAEENIEKVEIDIKQDRMNALIAERNATTDEEIDAIEEEVDEEMATELEDDPTPPDAYFEMVHNTVVQYAAERTSDDSMTPLRGAVRVALDLAFSYDSVESIVASLERFSKSANSDVSAWANETLELMKLRSPTSMKVALQAIRKGKELTLFGCLEMELRIAHAFCMYASPDFVSGVTAVVVNKNRKEPAAWSPATLGEVTDNIVGRFFDDKSTFLTDAPKMSFDDEAWEAMESRIQPYTNYGLPTEDMVESTVRGYVKDAGSLSMTREEVIEHFHLLYPDRKRDVEEKVSDIIDRKCRITDNHDGNYVWLVWGNVPKTIDEYTPLAPTESKFPVPEESDEDEYDEEDEEYEEEEEGEEEEEPEESTDAESESEPVPTEPKSSEASELDVDKKPSKD